MACSFCFSFRGNLDFPEFLQKRFITSTKGLSTIVHVIRLDVINSFIESQQYKLGKQIRWIGSSWSALRQDLIHSLLSLGGIYLWVSSKRNIGCFVGSKLYSSARYLWVWNPLNVPSTLCKIKAQNYVYRCSLSTNI